MRLSCKNVTAHVALLFWLITSNILEAGHTHCLIPSNAALMLYVLIVDDHCILMRYDNIVSAWFKFFEISVKKFFLLHSIDRTEPRKSNTLYFNRIYAQDKSSKADAPS